MRRTFFSILFSIVLLAAAPSTNAQESEYIHSFTSEIEIRTDGTVDVTEQIVYDFGTADRHGIYRNLPTDKTNEDGKVYRMGVDKIEVTDENGQPYNFTVSRQDDELELKIGDADKTITGVHTYNIHYLLSGAMSYFQDVDELYWNAVGTQWTVPILKAQATIYFPREIDSSNLQYTCFRGTEGNSAQPCEIEVFADAVTYRTEFIAPGEGMTVVLRFPMGAISVLEPEPVVNFFDTFWGKVTLYGILFGLLLWYVVYPLYLPVRWWLQGRDPEHQGVGVTQAWFEGPKLENGRVMTPAEAGAIIDEKIQTQEFTALIVSLAQRGYLTIVEKKKNDFELHKNEKEVKSKDLLPFEEYFLSSLFSSKNVIRIKDSGAKISSLVETIEKKMYEQLLKDELFPKDPKSIRTFYAVITGIATMTFNILLIISASIFGRIMPRKTLKGVHAANVAKSLKNFLTTQERQLEFQADKQMMFEKLLPYAVAFGVEKIWAKRFEDLTLKQPDWYQSSQTNTFTALALSNSLHSSFAGNLRSAATPTSSSSGFSSGFSGGSVGGGGGGGGGGSW